MEKYFTPFQDYSTADGSSLLCDISGLTTQSDADDDSRVDANNASLAVNDATPRLVTFDATADLSEGPLEEEDDDDEEDEEDDSVDSVVDAQENENVTHPEMHLDMLKVC